MGFTVREGASDGGGKNWIKGIQMKKGALHKQMGIAADKKIPVSKLKAAAAKGGTLGKRASLALTFSKMKKG